MIEIYADGADFTGILKAAKNDRITGFTTNPTLMKQAGITDYQEFARSVIRDLTELRPDTNISLEVFADDSESMYIQAQKIKAWGDEFNYDVFVKIPVMNTKGETNYHLIDKLAREGVKVNVTAIFTPEQTVNVLRSLDKETPSIVSIFSGRVADAGVDPEHNFIECIRKQFEYPKPKAKFLWASTREIFNLVQAERSGADIITMTHDQINKLSNIGKDLTQFSQETVNMFYNDAVASGFNI